MKAFRLVILALFAACSVVAVAEDIFSTPVMTTVDRSNSHFSSSARTGISSSAYTRSSSSAAVSGSRYNVLTGIGTTTTSSSQSGLSALSSLLSSDSYSSTTTSRASKTSSMHTVSSVNYTPFSDVTPSTSTIQTRKVPGGDPIGGFAPLSGEVWALLILAACYAMFIFVRRIRQRR